MGPGGHKLNFLQENDSTQFFIWSAVFSSYIHNQISWAPPRKQLMYAHYNANATWFMIYGAVSYLYPGLAFGNLYIPKNPITHTVCLFPSRGWRQMEDI